MPEPVESNLGRRQEDKAYWFESASGLTTDLTGWLRNI